MTAPSLTTLIVVPVRESCGGYTLAHAFRPKNEEPGMVLFTRGSPRTEHELSFSHGSGRTWLSTFLFLIAS